MVIAIQKLLSVSNIGTLKAERMHQSANFRPDQVFYLVDRLLQHCRRHHRAGFLHTAGRPVLTSTPAVLPAMGVGIDFGL